MEHLSMVVTIAVGFLVLLVALRFILSAIDKRDLQYSADFRRSVEEKGEVFDTKYAQYMAAYEQLGNRLTVSLRDNFGDLASDIKSQITVVNGNMLRMLPKDQQVAIDYRTTWRRYEKDIGRIIGLKV